MNRIELIKGDITKLEVGAIVNAANPSLLGGGGVDGAIHRAAGKQLLQECSTLNGCATGEAKITGGYKLSAKYVIHTVGPIWFGGDNDEPELLANCYKNCLKLAVANGVKTIAFPNISTGVYNFPKLAAAEIAIREVTDFLLHDEHIEQVIFVSFDDTSYDIYREKLMNNLIDNLMTKMKE